MPGRYDSGYSTCPCFWGVSPGSIVRLLDDHIKSYEGLHVLDVGCGDGRNAAYLGERGAAVMAFDISELAIANARANWSSIKSVTWSVGAVRYTPLHGHRFDIVVAAGLFHCLTDADEIVEAIATLKGATKPGGYHAVSALNSRRPQDKRAHPDFDPYLLAHSTYIGLYEDWNIIYTADVDLVETHPHNSIQHPHAMTRLIVRAP